MSGIRTLESNSRGLPVALFCIKQYSGSELEFARSQVAEIHEHGAAKPIAGIDNTRETAVNSSRTQEATEQAGGGRRRDVFAYMRRE